MQRPLAITSGEPAGIGPDLCLQLVHHDQSLVVIADKELLQIRAKQLGINILLHEYSVSTPQSHGKLSVLHVPLARPSQAGILDPANSLYVLETLRLAVQGCISGEFSGMVTAPVHKGIINDAGIHFTGHTEYLADQTHTPLVVMMLVGGGKRGKYGGFPHSELDSKRSISSSLPVTSSETDYVIRVALATTHLPLREVANAITAPLLEKVLHILQNDLQKRFGISHPRILVAGINPHAGEGGHLGREEIDVMIPILDKLRAEGMNVSAPLPADTVFAEHRLRECDVVLTMYHDQGLPVLKHASFGGGVNITLGLPIIRTSVDHGTALDLAGTGKAEIGSLLEAIKVATEMVLNERT